MSTTFLFESQSKGKNGEERAERQHVDVLVDWWMLGEVTALDTAASRLNCIMISSSLGIRHDN